MTRLLAYFFPLVLIAIEYNLRLALHSDLTAFAGPALASASAILCIPLTSPAIPRYVDFGLSLEALAYLRDVTRLRRDESCRVLGLLLLLCAVAAWTWCLVLAEMKDTTLVFGLRRPLATGLICYAIATMASEVKELL